MTTLLLRLTRLARSTPRRIPLPGGLLTLLLGLHGSFALLFLGFSHLSQRPTTRTTGPHHLPSHCLLVFLSLRAFHLLNGEKQAEAKVDERAAGRVAVAVRRAQAPREAAPTAAA